MNVRLILSVIDGDLLLFDGPPRECPPIPQPGDEIVCEQRIVRVEGVRHQYRPDHLEISLYA